MKFAFIYALPGYTQEEFYTVKTDKATYYSVAVDYAQIERAADVAKELVEKYDVEMIELCGGLANAHTVSQVKTAIDNKIPVGAVYYGPESRQALADIVARVKK